MVTPATITKIDDVEDRLSRPSDRTVSVLGALTGDVLVLGAGGKMGPSLARMARRAIDANGQRRRVIAVSRFSNDAARHALESGGVETISGDLMDTRFVESLPECENVVFMAGMKFGTQGQEANTWATNVILPGLVCRRFAGSRIVCLSTGNVYGLVDVESRRGSQVGDELRPRGEYAMSCVGRERVVEYYSRRQHTPVSIIRLNYATEFRYGVLIDLAKKVFHEEPISLEMGYFNIIWQADACNMTLCSLAHAASPPAIFNVTGSTAISCRGVCERLGELMGKQVRFSGTESPTALLSDAWASYDLLGMPQATLQDMLAWTTGWVTGGGESWDKPTHFEVRDGRF